MKLVRTPFLFILCVLTTMACGPKSDLEKSIQKRHDEVMVIHDEVMPKMRDIHRLKKKLRQVGDQQAKDLILELEKADDAMMDWMHQYRKPRADHEDLDNFFKMQMKSVHEMKQVMLTAIGNAEKHLAQ